MIEVERVLQPLSERHAAIESLDTYASAGELADAIASVCEALERSLRLLLRADTDAPEAARLSALDPATTLDAVVTALRRRDRISMTLAGRIHEAENVALRVAEGAEPRAGDADVVHAAVDLLREEVRSPASPPADPSPVRFALEETEPATEPEGRGSRAGVVMAFVAVVLLVPLVFILLSSRGDDARAAAIAAFEAGALAEARTGFETALGEDPDDVTSLLYLARIHRREERHGDAAAVLERAAAAAPEDPDVRRELGWLFMDLGRPEAAVEQFRRARDAAPGETSNWIGLVRALRAAGDPGADEVLREAPPEVQAAFGPAAS